eukprot:scaffold107793_cov42-Prasinocladus_malaysianus.AAC.2
MYSEYLTLFASAADATRCPLGRQIASSPGIPRRSVSFTCRRSAVPMQCMAKELCNAPHQVLQTQLTQLDEAMHLVSTPSFQLSEGLESPIQLFYLLTLLSILVVGAFLVVRQVLVRNELEETIKVLGERKRKGEATAEDYFELGVVLVRKKLYTQATQNLKSAQELWDGEPEELAQVHNAMGFSYFNMGKYDMAIDEYTKAVKLQPGYVTAWNNLGDAYEAVKNLKNALECYNEVLSYAPDNKVAQARKEVLDNKIQRRTFKN